MDWIRHHPRAAAVSAGAISLLVIVLLVVLLKGKDEQPSATLGLPEEPLSTISLPPIPSESPSASASPSGDAAGGLEGGLGSLGSGLGGSGGGLTLNGIPGGSVAQNLPRHSITLRVTSAAPIGTIGYLMPTSLRNSRGVVKNVGTSWSLSSTVYGSPDYAQIFVQAGARGFPITCTITVDGRVTEQRATEGPYGQMVCQG